MKKVNSYLNETGESMDFVTVWKKWSQFVARTWNNLVADFSSDFSDNIGSVFTKDISRLLREEFLTWKYGKVVVFYNYYVNTIKQIPVAKTQLPISANDLKDYLQSIAWEHYDLEKEIQVEDDTYFYDVEPSPEEVANQVIPVILDMMFYDTLLDAKASDSPFEIQTF